MLETLSIWHYYNIVILVIMYYSEKVTSADNQQGSPSLPNWRWSDPSETTRQAPFIFIEGW
jgi:hypothetical protein